MTNLKIFALLWVVCVLLSSCRQSHPPDESVSINSQQAVVTPVPTFTPTVQPIVQSGNYESVKTEENVAKPSGTPTAEQVSIPTATATVTRQPTATATKQPTSVPTPQYYVNSGANLRRGPGTNFEIVGGQAQGDVLSPIARTKDGEWIQIDQNTWIWAGLIEGDIEILPISDTSVWARSSKHTSTVLQPTHTPRTVLHSQTPINNYFVPFTKISINSEWYKGGNLHKGTLGDWCNATSANRLATVADMVAHSLTNDGKRFGVDFDMDDLYWLSVAMVLEIEGMILDVWGCSKITIAEQFVLIWMLSSIE